MAELDLLSFAKYRWNNQKQEIKIVLSQMKKGKIYQRKWKMKAKKGKKKKTKIKVGTKTQERKAVM